MEGETSITLQGAAGSLGSQISEAFVELDFKGQVGVLEHLHSEVPLFSD